MQSCHLHPYVQENLDTAELHIFGFRIRPLDLIVP
jgi:hypothetical protein